MSVLRKVLALTAALTIAWSIASPAAAMERGRHGPKDFVSHASIVDGRSIRDLTADWWQWALSVPFSQDGAGNTINPLGDLTGKTGLVGQSGRILFLTGTTGGPATREITIPTGKFIFFPLANFEDDNVGRVDENNQPLEYTKAQLAQELTTLINGFEKSSLYAKLNGTNVLDVRKNFVVSPFFDYWLPPADNIYQGYGMNVSGWVTPAISAGWWVMLKPLSVGDYTLEFGGHYNGALAWGPFDIAITYTIHVVPGVDKSPK